MKKSILMITLVMVFGLLCNTSLWAGNGKGAGDSLMADFASLTHYTITGNVIDCSGSGMEVDDGTLGATIVYGIGPLSYWESQGVIKPVATDYVEIDAVEVTLNDDTLRLIAVSISIDGEIVILRDENDGSPEWRGQGGGTGGGTGDGTGTCTQVTE